MGECVFSESLRRALQSVLQGPETGQKIMAENGVFRRPRLRRIGEFYQIVQGFLKEYLEQGKVSINPRPLTLNEEYIGSYETEKCHLRMGSQEVVFSPVGTRIIGSRGRIDMKGRAGKVRFLLVDKDLEGISVKTRIYAGGETPKEKDMEIIWTWKIATPPPLLRYVDLNEESFFDAIMEVANG